MYGTSYIKSSDAIKKENFMNATYYKKIIYVTFLLASLQLFAQKPADRIMTEISYGELVDKITILEIKSERIANPEKLKNIHIELASLRETYQKYIGNSFEVAQLKQELKKVNEILWDIEDDIRAKERGQSFDDEFIKLARKVYLNNDQRSVIKRKINMLLGSRITEEKSYTDYLYIEKK